MNRQNQRSISKRVFGILSIVMLILTLPAVSVSAQDTAALLELAGTKGGLIVHVGCSDGSVTARLRAGDPYFVHGLDTDAAQIAAARSKLIEQGIYGPVSVDCWDGRRLPYADNLVNLIVAEKPGNLSEQEIPCR